MSCDRFIMVKREDITTKRSGDKDLTLVVVKKSGRSNRRESLAKMFQCFNNTGTFSSAPSRSPTRSGFSSRSQGQFTTMWSATIAAYKLFGPYMSKNHRAGERRLLGVIVRLRGSRQVFAPWLQVTPRREPVPSRLPLIIDDIASERLGQRLMR